MTKHKPADVQVRAATPDDLTAIDELAAEAFGPGRFTKTAYRIREGVPELTPLCRVLLMDDKLVAAVRLTDILVGGIDGALLLGPIIVAPAYKNLGHGLNLLDVVGEAARASGYRAIILVGDHAYYAKAGYVQVPEKQITLPGPVDPARLLILELQDGAKTDFSGMVAAKATVGAGKR